MSDGMAMLKANMAALDAGEEMPHNEDMPITSDDPDNDSTSDPIDDTTDNDAEVIVDEDVDPEPEEKPKTGAKHMTKDEWEASGRDADDYMSSAEFNRVADFKEDSKLELSRRLAKSESMIQEMLGNQTKQIEAAEDRVREQTILDLKAKQQEAIEDDDVNKAVELEREIAKAEVVEEKPKEPTLDPAISSWYEDNKAWYDTDKSAANLMNIELSKAEKAGLPAAEGIKQAEAKVRKHFSYYFDDAPEPAPKEKAKPRNVTEQTRKPGRRQENKRRFSDLPLEQQSVAKKAAKMAKMTETEYMELMQ